MKSCIYLDYPNNVYIYNTLGYYEGDLAERLRRQTRNLLLHECAGSSPAVVECILLTIIVADSCRAI